MRVLGVKFNSVVFQRRLTSNEEKDLKDTCNQAFEIIGAKERAVITHGSCFPFDVKDTGIGSPYSNAAKEYIKFLSVFGFNNIQLGPCGELQKGSVSPYNSSAFSKNRLFIDLNALNTEKYGNLLSDETYNNIANLNLDNDKNYSISDFEKANSLYDKALNEVYSNFRINLTQKKAGTVDLNNEYKKFLDKNNERLDEEGVFKVLAFINKTDDYNYWENDYDKNLISDLRSGSIEAKKRFIDIYNSNYDKIQQYKFEQFLINKQANEHKKWREMNNFKYINDLLVGCSKMDAWRYKDIFLEDWEMGAYESNGPSQRWRIPIIDPDKIFASSDYDLAEGGKFLREKIISAVDLCENLRVDHVLGLVEPYIISKSANDSELITNPSSRKNNKVEKYVSELNEKNDYDKNTETPYMKIIEYIVLPTLAEYGIDRNDVVWENMCSRWPSRYTKVYKDQKLSGITNLDWERAEDTVDKYPNNWYMLGNHDSPPLMAYIDNQEVAGSDFNNLRSRPAMSTEYLAGYLNIDNSRPNIDELRNKLIQLYKNNDREVIFAKFAELFTTPKFQVSFDDFFGIADVLYNKPGTCSENNWKVQIPPDYVQKYYDNLASQTPTALNVPQILANALQAKTDMYVKNNNYDGNYKNVIYQKCKPILEKLRFYADVLKEKEV